jgi:hypothetical protein
VLRRLARKNLHTWIRGYARHLGRRALGGRPPARRHLLFAICDHYEPLHGRAPREVGDARVAVWEARYPELVREFRDADGLPPRHSFFFPGEEYDPRYLERLARLGAAGYGEVELHLHHDGDTADQLRADIQSYLQAFAEHGHVSREAGPGGQERYRFAFIHGNWCLANARRDGRWCGVDDEIPLLHQAGCYADFTFPSAPDECQPDLVNQIYWPAGDLARRRAYERGEPARIGEVKRDRLLMITGPLALGVSRRGRLPRLRIESSALSHDDPPSTDRLRTWAAQGISVAGRSEWVFVKVHTHGAPEKNARVLLGEEIRTLHRTLGTEFNDGDRWRLHYVTAREMFNIAIAAMEGRDGDPGHYRNHIIEPPPVSRQARAAA